MTRGDFPVGGSPEAVAKWFGFASVAELEASHARAAAEMTADTIAEELAEAEADDPDPWAAPPDYRPATREEKEAFHEEMQRRCADPEPAAEAENWYSADYDAEAAEYDVEPEAGPMTAPRSYWPAYLPYGPDTAVPYSLTPAAEAALAADEPAIDPERQADAYVTEICWPEPDNGIQRLYSPMLAEPEPELEAG